MKFYKNPIPIGLLVLSSALTLNSAYAAECSVTNIKTESASCFRKDHTNGPSKARASCNATIKAPKGYFFMKKDTNILFTSTFEGLPANGATAPQGRQTVSYKAANVPANLKNNPLVSVSNIFSQATAHAYCDRSGSWRHHRKTCKARAKIDAKMYPLSCLKQWIGG